MTTIRKVVVAGATGSLGKPVTAQLAKHGFEVTALTRDASKVKVPAGVKAVSVDYTSEESLREVLRGQDALVSTLTPEAEGAQNLIFQIAIAEGVKRVIPSEFGSATDSPSNRVLPVFQPKVALQEYIKKNTENTGTSYTFIQNNAFLDWGLEHDFFFNRHEKSAPLFDGGEQPFTATPLELVGDGVAAVLKHADKTANKIIKLHGITVTQKQLLTLYQKHSSADGWKTPHVDTREGLDKAYGVLNTDPSNVVGWLYPMLFRACFGAEQHIDWSKDNDMELLGLKGISEADLDSFVKTAVI